MIKCKNCGEDNTQDSKFCAACGTSLTVATQSQLALDPHEPTAQRNQHESFDQELQWLTSEGWQILNRTDSSAQLKKPKEWSKVGLVLFVLIPLLGGLFYFLLFGIALLGLIFVLVDYLLRKDKLLYLTADQVDQGEIPMTEQGSTWTQPLMVGAILILISVLCLGGIVFLLSISTR